MRLLKFAAAGGAAFSMLVTTGAMAAPLTRSASAMPAGYTVGSANSLRQAPTLKHKSSQSDGGVPAAAIIGGVALAAAIVVAAAKDGHNSGPPPEPTSPG